MKYRNDYIYTIIQRKNEFFSTKTLWLQLIDNDLVEELNEFVEYILNNEIRKNIKEKNNEDKQKYDIKDLNNKIINYKKLNNLQRKELIIYGKKKYVIYCQNQFLGCVVSLFQRK